jgi:ATP-binding cassette, subfamily C, bacterial
VLIGSLRRRPRDVAWLAVWSAVQALPAAASGWVLAEAAGMFLADRAAEAIGWLGLLAAAAVAGAFGTRQAYFRLAAIVEPLRDELVELIVAGALARSMDTARPPDTDAVARLTHQAEIVRDSYAGLLTVACTFAFTAASTLAGLVTLVPATLPYVVPPVVACALILRLLLRPFAARQRESVTGEETVARAAAQAVSGLRDVTACGAQNQVLSRLGAQVRRQADATRSVAVIGSARMLCLAAGGWLPLLLVLVAAPSMLRSGVSPARIIGVIAYISGSLRGALTTLSQGVGAGLVRFTVTLGRILEASTVPAGRLRAVALQASPGRPDRPAGSVGTAGVAGHGELRLHEVGFGYDPSAEPIIRGLSLDIEPGDHLAIVGPSGIGKSSLAGLLAGMLQPTAGEILLDGVPVTAYPAQSLPLRRVLIPQEAYVFTGTLAENMLYLRASGGTPDAGQLAAAAEAFGLGPLADRLGGYQAVVRPAALSAGQRQLIALARAWLSPAPVVILDEATCHLDPAAEERAETAFARRGGTLIVIAHRISSALRARRVLVLDGARAQVGVHGTLLADSAMYRDLVGYWSATAGSTAYAGPAARTGPRL